MHSLHNFISFHEILFFESIDFNNIPLLVQSLNPPTFLMRKSVVLKDIPSSLPKKPIRMLNMSFRSINYQQSFTISPFFFQPSNFTLKILSKEFHNWQDCPYLEVKQSPCLRIHGNQFYNIIISIK